MEVVAWAAWAAGSVAWVAAAFQVAKVFRAVGLASTEAADKIRSRCSSASSATWAGEDSRRGEVVVDAWLRLSLSCMW